jgi:hypothetical protein
MLILQGVPVSDPPAPRGLRYQFLHESRSLRGGLLSFASPAGRLNIWSHETISESAAVKEASRHEVHCDYTL